MVKYKKLGNTYHLYINSAMQLQDILKIHPSLWIATSAPINAFDLDIIFLNYIDCSEKNSRLIYREVQLAVKWLIEVLSDYTGIDEKSDQISLDRINREHPDGETIFFEAKKILAGIGNNKLDEISLEQIRTVKSDVGKYPVSESGVATVEAASTDELKCYMQHIIDVTGGEDHASGVKGIGIAVLEQFNQKLIDYIDWRGSYVDALKKKNKDLLPWGEDTDSVFQQYIKFKNKIDQYFIQCKVLSFSKQVSDNVSFLSDTEFDKINWHEITELEKFLLNAPLAGPNDKMVLDLTKSNLINPLFFDELKMFFTQISSFFGKEKIEQLSTVLWAEIKSSLSSYQTWFDGNPAPAMNNIGLSLLKDYKDNSYYDSALKIIESCKETVFQMDNIRLIEKLILFQKNMLVFVNNFVSMPFLYDIKNRSLFEKGSLIIDGRQMNFSVLVENKPAHMKIAKSSSIFVLYVEITPASLKKYIVVVPVTSCGKGNLGIGKRGVFIENSGIVSDAIVVDIIDNPISLREALLYPFKKIGAVFSSRFGAIGKEADTSFSKSVTDVSQGKSITSVKAPANKSAGFNPTSLLMGGSIAIAALGSSFAYIMSKLSSISPLKILLTVVVIIGLFLLFTLIGTYFKLKRRDLSPILEGSGWSINPKLKLTRRLARICTQKPKWPKGTRRKRL